MKTKPKTKQFRLNTVNLTKIKVQSMNDVDNPTRASNKLWVDTSR